MEITVVTHELDITRMDKRNLVLCPKLTNNRWHIIRWILTKRTRANCEAILQLKSEGLLTVVPQSGTYIAKVDLQIAEQARYAREQIEPQIMRDALTRLTPADLDWLDKLLVEQATDANETATFFARDEAFHQFFYERTGHELLWRWLKDLSKQLDRFRWLRVASQRLDWQALIAEHQAILTALRHDDADTAYRIAHTHLQHMIADQLAVIASYPDYF